MSDDLLNQIYEEVRKSGYPTELTVNKKFQSKNWYCTENQYYIDKDENKGREIDLNAHKSRQCHTLEDMRLVNVIHRDQKMRETLGRFHIR